MFGGWSTSNLFMYNSGTFLRFAALQVNGDPHIDNPTRYKAFNTAAFAILPAFTPRTNPLQYEGLTGPRYFQLDASLSKVFAVRDRIKVEFKTEAYNSTNSFIPSDPDVSVTSATFGRETSQQNTGRELQYTLRIIF
jgi:hypothetical protein